jgi:hypothetical protein
MPESDQGYGPPKVGGYTASIAGEERAGDESSLAAESSLAPESGAAQASRAKVTITLHGDGFIQRAMPLMVKIGDLVVLRNYEISPDRRQLTLHLDELPEDGAVIQVGYAGEQLVELPERFSLAKVEGSDPEV